jgi:hypothetical protein
LGTHQPPPSSGVALWPAVMVMGRSQAPTRAQHHRETPPHRTGGTIWPRSRRRLSARRQARWSAESGWAGCSSTTHAGWPDTDWDRLFTYGEGLPSDFCNPGSMPASREPSRAQFLQAGNRPLLSIPRKTGRNRFRRRTRRSGHELHRIPNFETEGRRPHGPSVSPPRVSTYPKRGQLTPQDRKRGLQTISIVFSARMCGRHARARWSAT